MHFFVFPILVDNVKCSVLTCLHVIFLKIKDPRRAQNTALCHEWRHIMNLRTHTALDYFLMDPDWVLVDQEAYTLTSWPIPLALIHVVWQSLLLNSDGSRLNSIGPNVVSTPFLDTNCQIYPFLSFFGSWPSLLFFAFFSKTNNLNWIKNLFRV